VHFTPSSSDGFVDSLLPRTISPPLDAIDDVFATLEIQATLLPQSAKHRLPCCIYHYFNVLSRVAT
jgi:hypothetical protein